MTERDVRVAQELLGVTIDGEWGPESTLALKRALAPARTTAPRDPSDTSLARRALAIALAEASRWGDDPVPATRIAEYFASCMRDDRSVGEWLASEVRRGQRMAFCAAAFGYCEELAARPGEPRPPHRAGAMEIMEDALRGRRPGERWLDATSARTGHVRPPVGSGVIYEREGGGHVERVMSTTPTAFRSVGFNEHSGRIVVDVVDQSYATPRLRGFVIPIH